jgi:biopolymer transport protein ExbD
VSLRQRSSGLRGSRRKGGQAVVELTPLIDIVFQLLIFFLLTATFQNNPSFKVKLPKAKNQDVSQEPKAVTVVIGQDGTFEVDGKVVDSRELEMRLCVAAQEDPTTGVNVKADAESQMQYAVQVMDLAKTCGMEKLGIVNAR